PLHLPQGIACTPAQFLVRRTSAFAARFIVTRHISRIMRVLTDTGDQYGHFNKRPGDQQTAVTTPTATTRVSSRRIQRWRSRWPGADTLVLPAAAYISVHYAASRMESR